MEEVEGGWIKEMSLSEEAGMMSSFILQVHL